MFLASNSLLDIRKSVHLYLKDVYQSRGLGEINDLVDKVQSSHLQNPVYSYRFIRRGKFLLRSLLSNKYFVRNFGLVAREILYTFWKYGWPSLDNLENAIGNILKVQHVYNFEVEEFANGMKLKGQKNCTFSSLHCYEIAIVALKSEKFTFAIEWLELAREKAHVDRKMSIAYIEFCLQNSIEMHNADFDDENMMTMDPFFFSRRIRKIPKDSKNAQKIRNIQIQKFKGKRGKSNENINYLGLCSGENLQTEIEKSFLFCWNEFQIHPIFMIGPMKMEFLSRNPDVIQIYELFNDNKWFESTLNKPNGHVDIVEQTQGRWDQFGSTRKIIPNTTSGITLSAKIEQFTGLNVENNTFSKSVKTASTTNLIRENKLNRSYNLSGHRISTLLLYFSNVKEGGATVFPYLGIAAEPIKGTGVLWYNVLVNGSTDGSTIYRECPILLGEDLIHTPYKITLVDHFFVQKCGLKPHERFQFPVNAKNLPVPRIKMNNFQKMKIPADHVFNNFKTVSKYSIIVPQSMKDLVRLEWAVIYPRIKYLYIKYRNKTKGTFREEFDRNNADIKTYLQDFEESTLNVTGSLVFSPDQELRMVEKIAWNPLAMYRLVSRFRDYVQLWVRNSSSIENNLSKKITSSLNTIYNISDGPLQNDIISAKFILFHIQHIYNLSVSDIASGVVNGIDAKVTLKAKDCYDIGKYAVSLEFFTSGVYWLEHALHLQLDGSLNDGTVKIEDVQDALTVAEMMSSENHHKYYHHQEINDTLNIRFRESCQGKVSQNDVEKARLFCCEKAMHSLKNASYWNFEHTMLRKNTKMVLEIFSARPNTNIVFEPETIGPIRKLMDSLTGLKTFTKYKHVPELRMTAYMPGSHRSGHPDSRPYSIIATVFFYLSDVDHGGLTAFVPGDFQVVPKKGSALFWYSLFSSGVVDESTIHGSCPVLFGEKWVAAKLIPFENQDHIQCHLKPNSRFEILMNGQSKYKTHI
ncbi:unnamed protein product [Allacma fusca]|uniref:Prolyl 4-hydroxylase alpha subunit domain-containing protein n=1 Tax=Allacma fusca TaxID=39272 RepID=A0A8J2L4Z4_9HEXA|nr:unnamed protein product [Allacma fusca]